MHVGYKDMADQVWGALVAVLDAEIVDYRGPGEGVTDILISGHSVGGALGTLLSARTQVCDSTQLTSSMTRLLPQHGVAHC